MRSLVDALRAEIRRLARKEVKEQIAALKAASARYRREIAELKRTIQDLERRLAHLEQQERRRATEPPPAKIAAGKRFSSKGLKSHRVKLGLSAADYGTLAGVSGQMIYKYERGEAKPREAQVAKLVAVRGLGKREAHRQLELLKG